MDIAGKKEYSAVHCVHYIDYDRCTGMSYVVFNHIWPFRPDEDWRLKWKSWPLQLDD